MTTSVDWTRLEHAYGPATDVPALLEDLRHPKGAERRKALEKLTARLNHQGWASPAAKYAVPKLLVALHAAKAAGDKTRLLCLLGDLAPGGNHQSAMLAGYGDNSSSLSLSAPLQPELREQIERGAELYRGLLLDSGSSVRSAAAFVLALSAPDETSLRAVETALDKESEPWAVASLTLSLGLLVQASPSQQRLDRLASLLRHEELSIRAAAACAHVWAALGPELLPILLEGARGGLADKALPFFGGKLSALCLLLAVRVVVVSEQLDAVEELIDLAAAVGGPSIVPLLGDAILKPEPQPPEEKKDRGQLSELELSFLRLCIELERSGRSNAVGQLHSVLLSAGLMSSIPALERFLNPDDDLVVERQVEGSPLWKHAWRAKDGCAPLSNWHALVRQLEPSDQLCLIRELAAVPYEIGQRARDNTVNLSDLFALLLTTIKEHSITVDALELTQVADPAIAAGFVAQLADAATQASWVGTDSVDAFAVSLFESRSVASMLRQAAGVIPEHVLPLLRLLPPEKIEVILLNVSSEGLLALAECIPPTPAIAKQVVRAARFARGDLLSPGEWRALLGKFQLDSISVFEEAAGQDGLQNRDLFIERIQQLRAV